MHIPKIICNFAARYMALLTIIFIIAILFGVLDILADGYPRLQRDLYRVAMLVVFFLFAIRYYYGPDILLYVRDYEALLTVMDYIRNPDLCYYEFGYTVFTAAMKQLGISYYFITLLVTTFYFVVIALLFRRVQRYRALALMVIVIMDFILIFATHRQCIAVSFFILLVLALDNQKYVWAAVCAIMSMLFHKSGMAVVPITLLAYVAFTMQIRRSTYMILFILLAVMLVIPLVSIGDFVVGFIPMEQVKISMREHLSLGRSIQLIWVIYAMFLLCMSYYRQYARTPRMMMASVLVGLVLIVALYQYFYLLVRLRSYFLPLLVVFIWQTVHRAEDHHVGHRQGFHLLKQVCVMVLLVFCTFQTVKFERMTRSLRYNIYQTCTVFDLRSYNIRQIQTRQIQRARNWWRYEEGKKNDNKI